jgi:hypothetical protein
VTEPTTKEPDKKPFLYVVVCARGIAGDVGTLITAAQEGNWDVAPAYMQGLIAPLERKNGWTPAERGSRCSGPHASIAEPDRLGCR